MSDETIKVCPFCGSEEVGLWLTTAPNGDDEYIVECDNCGCIYGKSCTIVKNFKLYGCFFVVFKFKIFLGYTNGRNPHNRPTND